MEAGQSEIEQKQQERAVAKNPFQLRAAGDADPPETKHEEKTSSDPRHRTNPDGPGEFDATPRVKRCSSPH